MQNHLPLYADLILPLALPGHFTYAVPNSMQDQIMEGMRVSAPFGAKKILSGMVRRLHHETPARQVKSILSLLDHEPLCSDSHLKFWDWMSDYYICMPGEVMTAALPSTLKPSSETRIILVHRDSDSAFSLNETELRLIDRLQDGPLSLDEASIHLGLSKISPLIKNLTEKGLIRLEEELEGEYKPKTEKFIILSQEFREEEALKSLFAKLEKKALKQLEALMSFIHLAGIEGKIPKKTFSEKASTALPVINGMVAKGIFTEVHEASSRFGSSEAKKHSRQIEFSEDQLVAIEQIKEGFRTHEVVLLHGITGSGKTEVYISLIQRVIDAGQQVLFLVPEIALTSQLVGRLREYFGSDVAVYHSRHNSQERAEIWNAVKQADKGPSIVIGARSAIFLPFRSLGLIVVDEEHDHSYKQMDPAPRYHARDAAIILSKLSAARVILGSATPSVESYHNAELGKYCLVELNRRFGGVTLPEIVVADMEEAYRKKQVRSHFSETLVEGIRHAISDSRQVILFQNRRGYALRLECQQCQWMPQCKNCDVTLVYHKGINKLQCHYCGYQTNLVRQCPECRSSRLQLRGFGTEKIEDELPTFFPDASIRRMDLDTTRGKQAHSKALQEFGSGRVDILVGTQMVSKGLDFDNVGLVGILNADNMLKFPDFRSAERSYQHLSQVSGRAGRKHKSGTVIIQTFDPAHPIIRQVIAHDYVGMYKDQILERRNFRYPPFVRMIRLLLLHRDLDKLNRAATDLGILLRRELGDDKVLGPEFPLITRMRNMHQKQIILKLLRGPDLSASKQKVKHLVHTHESQAEYKGIRVIVDVDPY
jgi:primosomal protein N' (replication factor Y) (superfamily II helicase)